MVPPSAFDKSYSFISMLSENKAVFDQKLNSATVSSISEEYNQLRESANNMLGDETDYKLEEKKGDITLQEILQHYKDMLKDLEKKYNRERKKIRKYRTTYTHSRTLTNFDNGEINPLLKNLYNPPVEGALSENTVLTIWGNKRRDKKFIQATCNLNFPKIKTLSITHMNKISYEADFLALNKFMAHALTCNLTYLHLS